MIRRSTWIILAIFVILLVALIWIGRSNQAESAPTPTTPIQSLFDFEESEIQKLVIKKTGSEDLVWVRNSDSNWIFEENQSEALDQDEIDSTLNQFISSRLMATLETAPLLSEIGLDPASYDIEFELVNGERTSIQIGGVTAIGDGYYIQTGDGKVVVINQFPVDSLVEFLVSPPILPTPTTMEGISP